MRTAEFDRSAKQSDSRADATGTDPLSECRALKNATYNAWIDAELARVEVQRHKWVHSKAN